MTRWLPEDDETLVEQLRALYRHEVARAERTLGASPRRPRVGAATQRIDGSVLVVAALAILVAAAVVVGQRTAANPSVTVPTPVAPSAAAAASGAPPTTASTGGISDGRTFAFSVDQTLQWPARIIVTDRSGHVASARGVEPFEFVPAPPNGRLPAALNRQAGQPSTDVFVLWPASRCQRTWLVTVDESAEAIEVIPAGTGSTCADLAGREILLVFTAPVDASRIAVTLMSK